MAQQCLFECGDLVDGCALSGSNGKPEPYVYVLNAMAHVERFLLGGRHRSRLLYKLALSKANKAFQPVRTDFDWLSRDGAVGLEYVADPLCGFVGTAQLWLDLIYGVMKVSKPRNQSRIPKNIPIYIFAGTKDPVSNRCKGLEQLISAYRRQNLTNVHHKFYPEGRHEMLQEINRDEVVADLLEWLDGIAGSSRAGCPWHGLPARGPPPARVLNPSLYNRILNNRIEPLNDRAASPGIGPAAQRGTNDGRTKA
jgi:alpha-beta hydrolase superfamily lysophospholipase